VAVLVVTADIHALVFLWLVAVVRKEQPLQHYLYLALAVRLLLVLAQAVQVGRLHFQMWFLAVLAVVLHLVVRAELAELVKLALLEILVQVAVLLQIFLLRAV
jgi:hypothetical protein